MARDLTHHEIEELLGAYALDAVDPDEAEAVELHLRACPRCRAEVADHREVAASLAHAGSTAPPDLWPRIAGQLEEPPPQLDLARVTSLRPGRRPPPPPSHPSRSLPVVAAAAAVVMVVAALGAQVVRQGQRIDRLVPAVEQRGLYEAVAAAVVDPAARKVDLRSEDGRLFATAVVQPDGDGYLVRHNLPPLSRDLTYQLWAMVGDRAVSVGVLGAKPGLSAFKVDAEVAALAVTSEQAGGAVSPGGSPLVSGALAAG